MSHNQTNDELVSRKEVMDILWMLFKQAEDQEMQRPEFWKGCRLTCGAAMDRILSLSAKQTEQS